jgi:hypothetical protein
MAASFYRFNCICQKEIESPEPTGTCSNCGRLYDVTAWGNDPTVIYSAVAQ